jgi:cob(I)alamin adenosyltransferase
VKIYTRTGDQGETGLFGSGRVAKSDPRVAAFGEVDELNAWIGVARAHCGEEDVRQELERVQRDLFVVGAILATPDPDRRKGERFDLSLESVTRLEEQIDAWDESLPELDRFVLPGGGTPSAFLHAARTVCRRAERSVIGLGATDLPEIVIVYLNRLSDYLFTCARVVNRREGTEEIQW